MFFFSFFPYSESGISGQTAGIRTSIYYTRPTIQRDVTASGIAPRTCDTSTKARPPLTPLQPSNVDITSAISQPGSCIKKKVAWADQGKQSLFDYTNYAKLQQLHRGFIKVFNRLAAEFDTRAKNWQGPEGLDA